MGHCASISKRYVAEMALEVVNEALQIFGGYGYTKMFPIEKIMRDVRLLGIYEGTSEIQHIILADYLLKEYPPSRPLLEETCRSIARTIPVAARQQHLPARYGGAGSVFTYITLIQPRRSARTAFFPIRHLKKCNILDAEN